MSTIKLVLTDLDGTVVLPGRNEVSEKVREAVIACESKGVSVVPVTGRPYEMAKSAMEVLGFDDFCVLDGGASIRKVVSGDLVWSRWLEIEVLKDIVTAILPFAVEVIDYFPTQIELKPSEVDIEAILEPAPYVFAALRNEDAEAVEAALAGIDGIVAHIMPFWMGRPELSGVQVTHIEADKYHGVAELLSIVGVSKEHVLGIGDSNNDLPLFRNAGLKIAMGNATERLKAEADNIVGTVEEDGFADAMERFVLN
jgi:HAD superfamily hydrolase (TIGR01484 family)